ncbi:MULTISPECIES: thiamine pyrophosphate-binding protein [unclassified Methanoregula]|uniref:thiamine pyrophosphate-binding protein n=1 Tax=unclassified Methanoregula TaxID=2649730 RepID=UPI0009C9F0E5|nr:MULTISPECIES: thiamine pyrophosphate-binding protein [unclassified Methanoregula]OPX64343.1 MAG: acetolactate synthase 2 catalytic subunit [Methanoregula sp. PtaB.Bin085]OPY33532.1 MAG: acetolactate synthase 2 catalytic subunit [Methanoregula sp. PtaU1.Bin006]
MKVSDYVIDSLAGQGVTHIFEICGGAISHLLDSLYGRTDITTVSMHHEMAASIAAEGYARAGGNIGVAMATSGPGATNLITGIGSCYFDSVPCLFITGQVNTYEYKFRKPVRQIGFQETDIVSIVRPIVKESHLVDDEKAIRRVLEGSFDCARTGRPGPVLIDIPLNIQRANVDVARLEPFMKKGKAAKRIPPAMLKKIHAQIRSSERPVILAGGGVRASGACAELGRFARATGIPVVSSLMGLDAFPHDDPLFSGMIGTYGNRYANLAVANADFILALGTRFDTRQTGTRPETFARVAKIVHVDIDPRELGNKIQPWIAVQSDIRHFLEAMTSHGGMNDPLPDFSAWRLRIAGYREKYPDFTRPEKPAIDPNYFFHLLSQQLPAGSIVCVDVGQIQMWAAQSLRITETQRFLTEGGMASIGSALPMAIGASFAQPGKPVVAVSGDGGFQLNIQELQTLFHHQRPVKVIVLNNGGYGMIRQFQEQYLSCRFQSSGIGYSNPDFQAVVSAYKIPARKITRNDEIPAALQHLFSDMKPEFLEVVLDETARVRPKLAVNRPVEDQEPLLDRSELRENMIVDMLPEPDIP